MTLRTVTYNTETHKIVPIEPTDAMAVAAIKVSLGNPAINGLPQWKAMITAAPEHQEPENPLDARLPCDITIGAGTIKKGCTLGTLVQRMNVLHQMAMQSPIAIAVEIGKAAK